MIAKVEKNLTLAVWMLPQSRIPNSNNSHKRQAKDLEISKLEENGRPRPRHLNLLVLIYLTETDDFGDFQHSPGPSATTSDSSTSFSSGSSEKLALEKFKLPSHSLQSSQGGVVKIPSLPWNKSATKRFADI